MTESVALDVRCERAARNQSLFREVNERIRELSGSAMFAMFICECTDQTCDEAVSLTRQEYERIRSDSNSFFVVEGHEIREIEEIVDSADRYPSSVLEGQSHSVSTRANGTHGERAPERGETPPARAAGRGIGDGEREPAGRARVSDCDRAANGVLIEGLDLPPEAAFELLRSAARRSRRQCTTVVLETLKTRVTPD
jgi:hypothetical protein